MFGSTNNLRRVYSCMSGKQIGYDTSYAQINSRLYTEQFDSHKGTGYRCIGGSGKTATNPSPANRLMGNGMIKDKALPKVAPTKNKGVTSPPLKPTPIVNVVKISFKRKSYHICCSEKEATMVGTPSPMYLVVPNSQTAKAIIIPPATGRKGG